MRELPSTSKDLFFQAPHTDIGGKSAMLSFPATLQGEVLEEFKSLGLAERLNRVLAADPKKYDSASVDRVRQLVQYETENPEKLKPYRRLESNEDFTLYHILHPEWMGRSVTEMVLDIRTGGCAFIAAYLRYLRDSIPDNKRLRKQVLNELFPRKPKIRELNDSVPRDQAGRILWFRIPPEQVIRVIEQEAVKLINDGRDIFQRFQQKDLPPGFYLAVRKYYPSGFLALKRNLKDIISHGQSEDPQVTRDPRGRIVWNLNFYSDEENEHLGIRNIQALFLEKFPEFNTLFPRNEDGKISSGQIMFAKQYIKEKIWNVDEFTQVFGESPRMGRAVPYFHGSHIIVIQKAFKPWGIDFEEVIYIRDEEGNLYTISAIEQREGLKSLGDYFMEGRPYSDVKPFILNHIAASSRQIDIVHLPSGNEIGFSVSRQVNDILSAGGRVLVFPAQDDKNLYQWVDFFEVHDNSINSKIPIASYRIHKDTFEVESRSWYGVARQLFLDVLNGRAEVSEEDLKEFTAVVTSVKKGAAIVWFGRIADQSIAISITDPSLKIGDELIFKPKRGDSGGDFIDGYVCLQGGREKLLCTRYFKRGIARLFEQINVNRQEDQQYSQYNTRLEEILKRQPNRYNDATISRIRKVIQYEVQNPGARKKYNLFDSLDDFILYFTLHPEWHESTTEVMQQYPGGMRAFYIAFNKWVRKTITNEDMILAYRRALFPNLKIKATSERINIPVSPDEAWRVIDMFFK